MTNYRCPNLQILFCFVFEHQTKIKLTQLLPLPFYQTMYFPYSLSVPIFAQFVLLLRSLLLFRLFALKIRDAPPQRWKPSLPEALQVLRNVVNTWVGIGVSVSATLPLCVCSRKWQRSRRRNDGHRKKPKPTLKHKKTERSTLNKRKIEGGGGAGAGEWKWGENEWKMRQGLVAKGRSEVVTERERTWLASSRAACVTLMLMLMPPKFGRKISF